MNIAMTIFTILGSIIIGCFIIPQTVLTLKTKRTANLSLVFYIVMTLLGLLFIVYGIGLIILPDPAVNNVINAPGNNDSEKHTYWLLTYVVPGAAIMVANIVGFTSSLLILILKLRNMHEASKRKMSEEKYIELKYYSKPTPKKGIKHG